MTKKKLYFERFWSLQEAEKWLNTLEGRILSCTVQKDIGTEHGVTGFVVYDVTVVLVEE